MGSEDLGGGWKANFKLEAGYNLDNGTGGASNTNNQANGGAIVVTGATAAATINGTPSARPSLGGAQGLTFNRWSYAGLSNAAVGEFRVGREYTPTFQAVLAADMVGSNGVQNTLFQTLMIGQANSHATATSASNGISYESPRMSGFGVKAQAFYGETTPGLTSANIQTGKSGDGSSYHASYVQGPISAGFGAQTTKGTSIVGNSVTGIGAVPGKYDVSTAYAKYDFGVAIAAVAQVTEQMMTAGTTSSTAAAVAGELKNVSNVFGLRVPMGATTLNANYTTSKYTVAGAVGGKGTQIGLQALYAMSKRTDLYVNYAVTDNGTEGTGKVYGIGNGSGRVVNVSNAGDKSTAYQIGMRHNF
jgi:predicted porin